MTEQLAIELVGIDKSFGPVQANRDIHLKVRKGSIHGIVGENEDCECADGSRRS